MLKKILILSIIAAFIFSCEKDDNENKSTGNFSDVKITVDFGKSLKSALDLPLTKVTPDHYVISLKSATLIGAEGTEDYQLFKYDKLSDALQFDFTDENIKESLLQGDSIPDGDYNAIKIEIYWLQMLIPIKTIDRGTEYRNFRIYLSDDAEFETGLHQPGDLTQIDENGREIGWLLGEGQYPNMDPVAPRISAYTAEGDGVSWYDFAGKNGADYGPFGDVAFMNAAPHPIYNTIVPFTFIDGAGENLIVEFNVENCWQFEDKSGDGYFGAEDLDAVNPTKWHMEMPKTTVYFE